MSPEIISDAELEVLERIHDEQEESFNVGFLYCLIGKLVTEIHRLRKTQVIIVPIDDEDREKLMAEWNAKYYGEGGVP